MHKVEVFFIAANAEQIPIQKAVGIRSFHIWRNHDGPGNLRHRHGAEQDLASARNGFQLFELLHGDPVQLIQDDEEILPDDARFPLFPSCLGFFFRFGVVEVQADRRDLIRAPQLGCGIGLLPAIEAELLPEVIVQMQAETDKIRLPEPHVDGRRKELLSKAVINDASDAVRGEDRKRIISQIALKAFGNKLIKETERPAMGPR